MISTAKLQAQVDALDPEGQYFIGLLLKAFRRPSFDRAAYRAYFDTHDLTEVAEYLEDFLEDTETPTP